MLPRAVPMAATRAEAPPPPGTGALEARTVTNSVQLACAKSIVILLILHLPLPGRAYFFHEEKVAKSRWGDPRPPITGDSRISDGREELRCPVNCQSYGVLI